MKRKYQFKATNLIAETFEKEDLKFHVTNVDEQEQLVAGYSVKGAPGVMVRFISTDDSNDVSMRVFELISGISKEKWPRIMKALYTNDEFQT